MTTEPNHRRPHPVPAASRLLSRLSRHGLAAAVDDQTAADIEATARFAIKQHTCSCDIEDQTHIVGGGCPPHPFHPAVDPTLHR